MTKSPEELLAMQFGGATVAENLRAAIEAGTLVENDDGTLELAADPHFRPVRWMRVQNTSKHEPPAPDSHFLSQVMFEQAYARSAVPYGCRECYKVKAVPRTLRQLVAAWGIAKHIQCRSKWGIDLDNPYSQDVYAGYFYTTGLDRARALFKVVREAFDADAKLGPHVPLTIKRGCSEFEAKLGPSDQYTFAPELEELETYLRSKFRKRRGRDNLNIALAYWIDVAYRIGDDTYLDFTGGKRLRPKMVTYDPREDATAELL